MSSAPRRPVLSICCMLRDELDVLPAFLSHHAKLVDRMVFVDHRSADGSRAFLSTLDRRPLGTCLIRLRTYDQRPYHQAAVTTAVATDEFRAGAGWVILLDADEFLDVRDRDQLEAALRGAGTGVAAFAWRNALVTDPSFEHGFVPAFDPRDGLSAVLPDATGLTGTVAVPASVWRENPQLVLANGNHSVSSRPGGAALPATRVGHVIHVPVRSVKQLATKRRNLLDACSRSRTGYLERAAHADQFRRALDVLASGSRVEAVDLFESTILHYAPELKGVRRERWATAGVQLDTTYLVELLGLASEHRVLEPVRAAGVLAPKAHPRSLRRRVRWRATVRGRRVVVRLTTVGALCLVAAAVIDPLRELLASVRARLDRAPPVPSPPPLESSSSGTGADA